MSDRKIEDATPDVELTGVEKIPVSDEGVAKCLTVGQVKDFTIAKITEIPAAATVSIGDNKVYILKDGELKPVSADVLAAAVLEYGFGKVAVANINGNEKIGVKDSTEQKTITVNALKDWLQSNLQISAELDILSKEDASTPLGNDNYLVIDQGSGNRKLTIANFSSWIHGRFAAYVGGLTAAATIADADILAIVQSGETKKFTFAQLKAALAIGDVIGPDATTEGNIPQWDSTQKKLKDGLPVVTSISDTPTGTKIPTEGAVRNALQNTGDVKAPASTTAGKIPVWSETQKQLADGKAIVTSVGAEGSDENVPTEKAVRDALNENGGVGCSGPTTNGNIPQWDSTQKVLKNGVQLVTSVRPAAQASDGAVPTEKAVRQVAQGFVSAPQSHNEDAIPVWGVNNELKAGKSIVGSIGSTGSDENVPTEKAVREALPVAATPTSAGLMSAADKAKLDGLVDTGAVEEVGGALKDTDTVLIKQGDTLQKKSLLYRFWTYILSKLPTVALDTFGAATDNTNLDASAAAHGLLPKLSGSSEHFLRGDGTWATPSGSDDFMGTDGENPGVHGLVPAPTAADANKFLNADGTWTTPPSAAGVDIPGAAASEGLVDADLAYFFVPGVSGYRKVTAAQIRQLVMGTKRYDTVFVPAGAMTPANTDGATPGVITFENVTHDTMAFPATANKKAEFSVVFPDDWDKGPVKAKLLWTVYDSTKAEAGQHVGFKVGAVSAADGDNITVAPTTFVELNDQVDSANELHRSAASAELTFDGVPGDGNLVHFVLKRDAAYAPTGGSPMPTEAIVLGVIIQYGRTASYTQW